MKNDFELLREYVETASEAAFTELVERHKGLVYASALRQTGDASLAEEITQAVFIVLARKAASFRPGTILSGWLFRATRFAAADARKSERRRLHREREAMNSSEPNESPTDADAAWDEIAPVLDESLARLGQTDRNALLLRFFERKSLSEVGAALGVSEEASRKRVHRALEKLRSLLSQRGVVVPAAILATVLTAQAAPTAPVVLSASALATTPPLVKATLALMTWSKAKIATFTAVALLLAGGGAVVTFTVVQHLLHKATPSVVIKPPAPPVELVPEEMTMTVFNPPAADANGFISLFNGRDLNGWNYNSNVWFATNGVLTGRVPPQAPRMVHYIAWAGDEVDDFELHLRFRIVGRANSGVPIRARWAQQRWFPGYQAEIDNRFSGRLVIAGPGRDRLLCRPGWRTIASEENGQYQLQTLEEVATSEAVTNAITAVESGQWCDYVVLAQGRHFITRLNGVTMIDTRDEHPTKFVPRGMLGLEYSHREGAEDSVEFKDILFKRLPSEPAP